MKPEVTQNLAPPKGNTPEISSSRTNPNSDVGQGKEEKSAVGNTAQVDSTRQEDFDVLRQSETLGNVHQRLGKETDNGKALKVVIISAASSMRVFHNPKLTRKLIEESVFGKHLRGPIEVKGKGRSVKIMIDSNVNIDVSKIKRLGDFSIQAWCPLNLNHRVGVVSPVDLSIDIDTEFTPYLKLDSNSMKFCKIVEVRRMRKHSDLPCVKVVFEGGILPKEVIYDSTVLPVRPFLHNPLICYKCCNFGHGASSCTNKIVCPHCLGNHTWNECSLKNAPKCLRCKLEHETGSTECEFFTQASKIENMKRNGEISYDESKKLYNILNNCNLIQVRNDIERNILRGYEAPISQDNRPIHSPNAKKKNCDSNSVDPFPLSNRFDILNSTFDDLDSNETEREIVKESKKVNRPKPIYVDMLERRFKENLLKPKRRHRTYAHAAASSDLEMVSDESFTLNSSPEQEKAPANNSKSGIKLNFENLKKNPPENKVKKVKNLPNYFNTDCKDSFLYQLLNKIHNFYDLPNKTGFQWISFLIELLDFVGQYKEEDQ